MNEKSLVIKRKVLYPDAIIKGYTNYPINGTVMQYSCDNGVVVDKKGNVKEWNPKVFIVDDVEY